MMYFEQIFSPAMRSMICFASTQQATSCAAIESVNLAKEVQRKTFIIHTYYPWHGMALSEKKLQRREPIFDIWA